MSFGLYSSVLVRLLVGGPAELVSLARKRLLEAFQNAESVHASDVVIAEMYYALKYRFVTNERD